MSRPYFEINEPVGLVSKNFPELNGDGVVEEVFTCPSEESKWLNENYPVDGMDWVGTEKADYPCYILFRRDENRNEDGHLAARCWAESALRKKHKPYEGEVFDFSEEDSPYKIGEEA